MLSPNTRLRSRGGLAHFTGLPHVAIDGDAAVVTSYLQILVPQTQGDPVEVPNHGSSQGFRVHRMTANRWELVRTPQGWKIKHRTLRPLDGSEPARTILRRAIASNSRRCHRPRRRAIQYSMAGLLEYDGAAAITGA